MSMFRIIFYFTHKPGTEKVRCKMDFYVLASGDKEARDRALKALKNYGFNRVEVMRTKYEHLGAFAIGQCSTLDEYTWNQGVNL
jgi:hypothetical protein